MDPFFQALRALADPKAPYPHRRRGLRLYALSLLGLQGLFLFLLAPLVPRAGHPSLWPLAFLGGGWLLWLGTQALKEETLLAPLVAAGLGASLAFFLGVMGLLLWPFGLALFPLGLLGFTLLLRRAEAALGRGGGGGP
ncbi:hypothetical protein QT17_10445 [Thermus sp. 2.9]|uniref:hypothetical protein n=1 Tax=Thermus sp. (strain 2.9) TaxID=1577051 RepID=UPI0005421C07|nr:hypothetical protein [Thermus sp. 2.9]KHG64732.1 hypothetical protein QT17_10445 [Thermus sp. 2.9]